MIRTRLQAPRSLWDPSYDEESWVSQTTSGPIYLIPRLREMIAQHYPGTKISITEYFYGRGGDISGGIAQADVLGIFGREGVFAATLWPQAGLSAYGGSHAKAYAYVFGAFRAFLDYDGNGGRFGDTGAAATTSDAVNSSVYASLDAQGRVVLVAINKRASTQQARIVVSHGAPLKVAGVWAMTDGSPTAKRQADPAIDSSNTVLYAMPPMSVSTIVLAP
jgi:hypothetical protein